MSKKHSRAILIGALCLGGYLMLAAAAWAQQAPQLDLKTTVEKEVRIQKSGQWVTERIPAEKTNPRDTLVFTVTYRNLGASNAVDAVIVNPIPGGTIYRIGSAEGQDAAITCSIDNSLTWHQPPVMMPVKKPDGTLEMKPAPPERYTHLRWMIKKPIPPGQSGRVSFKVIVK